MKTIKLLSGFALIAILFTSCYSEVIVDDYNGYNEPVPVSINQVLKCSKSAFQTVYIQGGDF